MYAGASGQDAASHTYSVFAYWQPPPMSPAVMVEPVAPSFYLSKVEDEELTPETAAAIKAAKASLVRGEGVPHEEIIREFNLSR